MAFLDSLSINASGLTASRLRMDIISENIANADTTSTPTSEAYRRKVVVYEPYSSGDTFSGTLGKTIKVLDKPLIKGSYFKDDVSVQDKGVKVTKIIEDQTPFTVSYDPTNPNADEDGYVELSNVDTTKEILDMMSATRAYEANITALNAIKQMATKALEL
ncbi:MAG: flagellar basal body rod protein FlgC [Clostridiales bacterium]|nr:flagellar basal body rod protein FlgC [Clostridiales bacterium]